MKTSAILRTTIGATVTLAVLLIISSACRSQQAATITHQKHDLSFSMGRDFWLAEMSNDWGDSATGGAYMDLYISSPKKTVVHIAYGSFSTNISIDIPDSTYFYRLPNSIQMQSSGFAEKKEVHIWSSDAPLVVYNMNHVPYYQDGEYIIPTIGWDTEYVVAGYGSLYEGPGTYTYDVPSEFVIVVDEDSTGIDITPTVNCRHCPGGTDGGDSCSTVPAYPAGQAFHITLSRGESFELFPVKATDPDNFDLTGTIIHSDKPIGLLAGSVDPNIPADFPYANHVEEMIPSLRTWGETYYGSNWYQPPGNSDDYTRYLFVSSRPGQTIYRSSCTGGGGLECQIGDRYGIYWDELASGQKFSSDAPFLLVAYANSSTYPGGQNGNGTPSECVIAPREQFIDTLIFETPPSVGNIEPYTNYAHLTANITDANSTFVDGRPITGLSRQCLDDTFGMYFITLLGPGTHVVTDTAKPSQGGVGVFLEGFGYNETYSWSSPEFEGTFSSSDTTSPLAEISGECSNRHVTFLDTGTNATKIAAIWLDTLFNASFTLDTAYKEGVPRDSEYFDFIVINPNQPAMIKVTAYDVAGNSTTVTLSYVPLPVKLNASSLNFGSIIANNQSVVLYDTLLNKTADTIDIQSIYLLHGSRGFRIDSATIGAILPDSERVIKLSFDSVKIGNVFDTAIIANGCTEAEIALEGAGVPVDWTIDSAAWHDVPFPSAPVAEAVTVHNRMTLPITLTGAQADSSEFTIGASQFPITVAASSIAQFIVDYTPAFAGEQLTSLLHVQSAEAGTQSSTLRVTSSASVSEESVSSMSVTSNGGILSIRSDGAAPIQVELINLLGEAVLRKSISGAETIDCTSLPRGIYFYRVNSNDFSQTGKLFIGN